MEESLLKEDASTLERGRLKLGDPSAVKGEETLYSCLEGNNMR